VWIHINRWDHTSEFFIRNIYDLACCLPATSGHWPQTPVHFSAACTCQSPQATNFCDSVCCLPATSGHLPQTQFRGVIVWSHINRCDHTSTCSDSMERSVTPEALFHIFGHNSFIIGPIFKIFFSNVQKEELYPRTSHYPRVREPGPQNPRYIEVPVYQWLHKLVHMTRLYQNNQDAHVTRHITVLTMRIPGWTYNHTYNHVYSGCTSTCQQCHTWLVWTAYHVVSHALPIWNQTALLLMYSLWCLQVTSDLHALNGCLNWHTVKYILKTY